MKTTTVWNDNKEAWRDPDTTFLQVISSTAVAKCTYIFKTWKAVEWWKWNNFVKSNFILLFLGRIKQNNQKNAAQRGGCNPLNPSPGSASDEGFFYLEPTGRSPTKAATSSLYQNIAKFPPKLYEVKRHKLLSKLIGCFQYCPRVLDGHSNLVRQCKSDWLFICKGI